MQPNRLLSVVTAGSAVLFGFGCGSTDGPQDVSVQSDSVATSTTTGQPSTTSAQRATDPDTGVPYCIVADDDVRAEVSASRLDADSPSLVEVRFTISNAGGERCFLPLSYALRVTDEAGDEVLMINQHGDCAEAGCEIIDPGGTTPVRFEWPQRVDGGAAESELKPAPAGQYTLGLGLTPPRQDSDAPPFEFSGGWTAMVEVAE